MDESSEVGKVVQDVARGALDVSIKYLKVPQGGHKIGIHISTDNIKVAKELVKLAGYTGLGITVISLGALLTYKYLKPIIESAVKDSLGGERDDQDVDEIKKGSLHVILRCFTDERFLEVIDDCESGRIGEHLQNKFSQLGIEVEGLKVDIENKEEINKTKEAIYSKRSCCSTEIIEESEERSVDKTPKINEQQKEERAPMACFLDKLPDVEGTGKFQVKSGQWNSAQRARLAIEKLRLDNVFPACVKWIDPTGDTKVEVTVKTNDDNQYTLRIYIGDFPNSVPDMVVVSSPKPMPKWDASYTSHTLSRRDGYLRVSHCHSSQWTDRSSLYEVIIKGRAWLEAYEAHLRTGKSVNYFLGEMGSTKYQVKSGQWNSAQRHRLAIEKLELDNVFPACVKWIDPTGDTKVEVTVKTNNDNRYILRIYIGDFPNSAPDMVVVSSPKPMPKWEGSYTNHTLSRRDDGYLRISYCHSSQWTDRSSLYGVIMKGRAWLEAYEAHLRTGKPVNYFLGEMGISQIMAPSSHFSFANFKKNLELHTTAHTDRVTP